MPAPSGASEPEVRGDICGIRDLSSTNETYAHGRAVAAARLKEGDSVTFGLLAVHLGPP